MDFEGRWLKLDDFVDIDGLRQLDDEVRAGIERCMEKHGVGDSMMGSKVNRFFPSLPDLRYDKSAPVLSKLKTINLKMPRAYTRIHLADGAEPTEMAREFPGLVRWVESLPLLQHGRFFVIFDHEGAHEPIHRGPVPYQEFFWLRTNLDKQFFVFDETTQTKHYFEGHAVWFDQHTYHGCDETPVGELQWSIRVDGQFTPEVRKYIAEHFRGWTDEQRTLVPRYEQARDLDDLYPALSSTPDELGKMVQTMGEP
ncbi:MAG: hypothetical protein KTR31_11525 [Myxococcales bacterium]|nr:hypothetical protein [Myxococcales bacterium]